MKKALRLFITGSMQSIFYRQFIKDNADKLNVKGFMRHLEDGRIEIFMEGNNQDVNVMTDICKTGPKYAQIRKVEEKDERMQDFKDFRIFKF